MSSFRAGAAPAGNSNAFAPRRAIRLELSE